MGEVVEDIDLTAEKSYVRKVDLFLLPLLCLSNLANAKTDGMDDDLSLKGNEYSLIVLLFYIPFGLCDLPWNLLLKRYSGRIMLSFMTVIWGVLALCQCAAKNFGGMLAIRIILGIFEAGFFAGATFYFTLFYTRGEMGFRLAIMQSFAVLASAFSGLISFGVFQINYPAVHGWQWLFIIEGSMTLLTGIIGFWWLPDRPQTAWFLNEREQKAATARLLRDTSSEVETGLDLKSAFQTWKDWKFPIWCIITFTYPVAYATAMNFFPLIVQRLGFSTVKTNLWTVAPNLVGAVILLCVAKSSDYFRERGFHIVFSLILSLVGMIILATIDVLANKGVAYFACFLMAAGAYIPSCLVHAWHNNNNVHENSRAANTGFFVGLGNLAGVLSAATFRTEYAPKYIPTLLATCCCNGVCIVFATGLAIWMRLENRRRDHEQGTHRRGEDVDTRQLSAGEDRSPALLTAVYESLPLHLLRNVCTMKTHACQWPNCQKTFTRAEHLRRHALNHEQARNGYTCERSRHMMRHAKRDEEAGGPGLGVLETRKRTRRAGDGSIVTRPAKRQGRRPSHTTASLSDDTEHPHGAPVSPPGSASDPPSLSLDETDSLLAPMMPGGPFEPFVEPIPGQFDAADGPWSLGLEPQGLGDGFGLDTATDFNMPFAATHNYNWLFDVASLDDAFHQLDLPLGPDMMTFADALDTPPASLDVPDADKLLDLDGSSVLLQAASYVERNRDVNLTLNALDMDWMGPSILDASPAPHLPRLTEDVRQGILGLVNHDALLLAQSDTLLSLSSIQSYSDLFFTRFNTVYPLIHQPTFSPTAVQPVFMASILCMGATYSTREAHQLAVSLHEHLRTQLFCNEAFSPSPSLWVLQTMLLIDCFGKMRAGPKQREMAQLFHCVLIKLIRRSGACNIRHTGTSDFSASGIEQDSDTDDVAQTWRSAMEAEQRKRVVMHCFMWDTQHAVLFSQSLCMSAFEIRCSLPCSASVWEAPTAEEWMRAGPRDPEHSFLSVLKGYITPGSAPRPRDLNPLARVLILHGLMSVSSDLKRRDQTTIRETPERLGAWTRRMGRSYDLWKIDFDADCLSSKLSSQPQASTPGTGLNTDPDLRRLPALKSSAHALYRAAHIALNVELLDLQIAAGATHILSRGVTDSDRARSLSILPRWLQTSASVTAARHAAHLLQDAILSIHEWEAPDAFHFPWCLYLGTLACWAFHFPLSGQGQDQGQGRVTTDVSSLIVAMTSCEGDELGSLGGKYETRGLVMAMAQQLAVVRWGVVHDAMKVLVNLGGR
ncbi:MFS general substrate transporter [Aspergillus steynii IBT 23096]|uniref:MFS general substrate transporter n=1 Tax=Aspergillus steynii IBT 23096 TaxID=1392250 RepID=A0A2I2GF36_9EURO|nr:MFS general substrate transporter [Aspergillus steynii IBT 23096]PLB51500.1 MFS general substrate transporter [Aspergillus steynii IBT 23096]